MTIACIPRSPVITAHPSSPRVVQSDVGNNGAGIYNLGKVNVKGDSVFQNLNVDLSDAVRISSQRKQYFLVVLHPTRP